MTTPAQFLMSHQQQQQQLCGDGASLGSLGAMILQDPDLELRVLVEYLAMVRGTAEKPLKKKKPIANNNDRPQFRWADYPELECLLLDSAEEFYRHARSSSPRHRPELTFSNQLIQQMREIARRKGYIQFLNFGDQDLCSKILCFYRTLVNQFRTQISNWKTDPVFAQLLQQSLDQACSKCKAEAGASVVTEQSVIEPGFRFPVQQVSIVSGQGGWMSDITSPFLPSPSTAPPPPLPQDHAVDAAAHKSSNRNVAEKAIEKAIESPWSLWSAMFGTRTKQQQQPPEVVLDATPVPWMPLAPWFPKGLSTPALGQWVSPLTLTRTTCSEQQQSPQHYLPMLERVNHQMHMPSPLSQASPAEEKGLVEEVHQGAVAAWDADADATATATRWNQPPIILPPKPSLIREMNERLVRGEDFDKRGEKSWFDDNDCSSQHSLTQVSIWSSSSFLSGEGMEQESVPTNIPVQNTLEDDGDEASELKLLVELKPKPSLGRPMMNERDSLVPENHAERMNEIYDSLRKIALEEGKKQFRSFVSTSSSLWSVENQDQQSGLLESQGNALKPAPRPSPPRKRKKSSPLEERPPSSTRRQPRKRKTAAVIKKKGVCVASKLESELEPPVEIIHNPCLGHPINERDSLVDENHAERRTNESYDSPRNFPLEESKKQFSSFVSTSSSLSPGEKQDHEIFPLESPAGSLKPAPKRPSPPAQIVQSSHLELPASLTSMKPRKRSSAAVINKKGFCVASKLESALEPPVELKPNPSLGHKMMNERDSLVDENQVERRTNESYDSPRDFPLEESKQFCSFVSTSLSSLSSAEKQDQESGPLESHASALKPAPRPSPPAQIVKSSHLELPALLTSRKPRKRNSAAVIEKEGVCVASKLESELEPPVELKPNPSLGHQIMNERDSLGHQIMNKRDSLVDENHSERRTNESYDSPRNFPLEESKQFCSFVPTSLSLTSTSAEKQDQESGPLESQASALKPAPRPSPPAQIVKSSHLESTRQPRKRKAAAVIKKKGICVASKLECELERPVELKPNPSFGHPMSERDSLVDENHTKRRTNESYGSPRNFPLEEGKKQFISIVSTCSSSSFVEKQDQESGALESQTSALKPAPRPCPPRKRMKSSTLESLDPWSTRQPRKRKTAALIKKKGLCVVPKPWNLWSRSHEDSSDDSWSETSEGEGGIHWPCKKLPHCVKRPSKTRKTRPEICRPTKFKKAHRDNKFKRRKMVLKSNNEDGKRKIKSRRSSLADEPMAELEASIKVDHASPFGVLTPNSRLNPFLVPVPWVSPQTATLHALIQVRIKAGSSRSAINLCHNTLKRLYHEARAKLEALPGSEGSLRSTRDQIAELWCLYARTLLQVGGSKGRLLTESSSLCPDYCRDQAVSALLAALSCPLAGNHALVSIYAGRLCITSSLRCSKPTANTLAATRMALDLAVDGIGRAHAGTLCKPRFDLSSWSLQKLKKAATPDSCIVEMEVEEYDSAFSSVLAFPTTLRIESTPYAFVDLESASLFCAESNRLSRFHQELLEDTSATIFASGPSLTCLLEELPDFQPLACECA